MNKVLLIGAAMLVLILATYKLTESPPIWFDEGHITQVAKNTALYGPHAQLQVAPGEFVSAAFSATTGFPVTYPVAGAFALFGPDILVGRVVMVIFIALFALCAWLLIRKETSPLLSAFSLLLIATFAPLYGNGKNVLGEVPGLFYLVLFLLSIWRIEQKPQWQNFLLAGAFLGLTLASKPIFLLLLPAVGVVLLFSRNLLSIKNIAAAALSCAFVMALWISIQFGGQSLAETLSYYFNPFGADVASSFLDNALLFVTEVQPLYALLLLGVWVASVALRYRRGISVSRAEYVALLFAACTYLAFLRITPYYRYFFLGEVLALLYLPKALALLWPRKVPIFLLYACLSLLIAAQAYQSFFSSWVSEHYDSHRTEVVREVVGSLPTSTSVFFYNVPELPLFLAQEVPYYQYLYITPILIIGENKIPLLALGVPDMVIIGENPKPIPDLSRYQKTRSFDRYELWERRDVLQNQ